MAAETIKGDRGGIGLTGMATQSSISVSGSSEQKVPSVRKGGRGGGGNRNSGGGPGHSGHSVLSSVSSSSILHLSVLKTTRKINARLILLTELLIGGGGEALSLPPLTHHLPNLFHLPSLLLLFFFFFFRLAWRVDFFFSLPPPPLLFRPSCSRSSRTVFSLFSLENRITPSRPVLPAWNAAKRKARGKQSTSEISLLGWSRDRTRTILPGRGSKREKPRRRKGKGRGRSWRINSLANEDTSSRENRGQRTSYEAKGEVKKKKEKYPVDRESWVKLITGQDPFFPLPTAARRVDFSPAN